jgi:prophage regulatory protein
MPANALRFIPEKRVRERVGYPSRSTLLRWEKLGLFPKRRRIGPNRIAYLENEINNWLELKARGR